MSKTININLGGSLFQVDEEAFLILRDYIQAINTRFRNVPGGNETIEDIESRISEIFLSQKGIAGVVTKENVQSMISILGKPEDFDAGITAETPQSSASYNKRLYRNPNDTILGGVCGGLGAYFKTDPVLFRILFVIFTLFFFTGLFIYILLWIAVPKADTEVKKREMYGRDYYAAGPVNRNNNGLNEVVSAFGKVLYVILRIFMIIFGSFLVLTGFLAIISFVVIFVFKYPGAFSHHGVDFSVTYFPEIFNYIFTPAAAPWIVALITIVVLLPLLAFIYWGIKMIFLFRAKDGLITLTGLILWVASAAVLSIILFNEGVSFAETSSTTTSNILPDTPDTLFVVTGNKIKDLDFDNEFSLDNNEYSVFLVDESRNIYIKPGVQIDMSESNEASIEVKKRSSGRTRKDARNKSESLIYNYNIQNDTLYLDEYFTLPAGSKWTADFITVYIRMPERTVFWFDSNAAKLLHDVEVEDARGRHYDNDETDRLGRKFWIFSGDGLREIEK